MKSIKLKRLLVCSALALSIPAIAAETNPAGSTPPFNGSSSTTTGGGGLGGATPPFNGGGSNPATSGGLGDITAGNTGQTTTPASPNGSSPSKDGQTALPEGVKNEDLKEAVADCPLQASSKEAIAEAMRVARIVPDIDATFNNKSDAAAGCFAASSKVINLAMEIPSVSLDWSNLGNLVKKNIERILAQKAEEVLAKGCAIADQALIGALEPVQEYMNGYKNRVGEFNGLVGNFEMGAEYDSKHGNIYDDIAGMIGGQIQGSQASIEAASEAMRAVDKDILARYSEELANNPLGGGINSNTGGGSGGANIPRGDYATGNGGVTDGIDDGVWGSAQAQAPAPRPKGGGEPVAPFFGDNPPAPRTAPPPPTANNTTNPYGASKGSAGNPF